MSIPRSSKSIVRQHAHTTDVPFTFVLYLAGIPLDNLADTVRGQRSERLVKLALSSSPQKL